MTPLRHPRLHGIADYLDGVRGELAGVIESVSAEVMNRAPRGERWSGAQVIQHLGRVEGSLDRFAQEGAVLRPLVAPPRLPPDPTPDLATSWASLQAVRGRTYRAYSTVDGKDLTTIAAPHPFFGPLAAT